jgi:hypothetical protein
MKKKTLGWIVALATLGHAAMSCSQPKPECQTALASTGDGYAVTYIAKSTPAAGCEAGVLTSEVIGMEQYHPATADGTTYDPEKSTVAVQSDSLQVQSVSRDPDPNPDHHVWSLGAFDSVTPDANDICKVTTFTVNAEQDFPAMAGTGGTGGGGTGTPPVPAQNIGYKWSNMKVYVTAAAPGTQFEADLTYTTTVNGNSCTYEYHAVGLWPGVTCYKRDDTDSPVLDENGNMIADDSLCSPCANPDAGFPIASGISPDFPTRCDPTLFACVLADKADKTKNATSIPQILSTSVDCGPVE